MFPRNGKNKHRPFFRRTVLMLKKTVLTLLSVLLCGVICHGGARAEDIEISARAAIVTEPYTGTVLFEKNADERLLIASTTKIMTALVVVENCALDERVSVTQAHAGIEGSSMYLKPGGDYTVEDVLYGLILASGNDAGAALADHCAGSMEAFAALMNQKCEDLGLENTHFVNSHGLDDEEHYSTARDLATITAAAMENDTLRKIFGTVTHTVNGITYTNHNKLLRTCEGCIGGKTGYTSHAGRILVSCVEREGMRLICVTISDPNDWDDHAALYDKLYGTWRYLALPESRWQRLEVMSGLKSQVRLQCSRSGLVVPKGARVTLDVRLPRFVYAPVLAGMRAGTVTVSVNGAVLETAEIWYRETVSPDPAVSLNGWERFKRFLSKSTESGVYYLTD